MDKIGVNPINLLTQVVNFTILVVLLTKLVYKPVLAALEKRRKKIEEGLALTEKLTQEKEEIARQKDKIIAEAGKEAKAIVDKARLQGKKVEQEVIADARVSAAEIIERGKKDVEIRMKEMEEQLRKETIDIATLLTQKLIGNVLDKGKQQLVLKRKLSEFLQQRKLR